jgi:hypothetical protein
MAGHSADEIHQDLIERLEAEKFAWDDDGLRAIAAKLADSSSSQKPRESEQPDRLAAEREDGSDGTDETPAERG